MRRFDWRHMPAPDVQALLADINRDINRDIHRRHLAAGVRGPGHGVIPKVLIIDS